MSKEKINITVIANDKNQVSQFSNAFLILHPNQKNNAYNLGSVTDFLPLGQLQFRSSKINKHTANWHVEPDPFGRLIIYLSGKYKITVGNKIKSESRIFKAGEILFFNDQIGLGHITEVIEEGVTLTYKFAKEIVMCKDQGLIAKY